MSTAIRQCEAHLDYKLADGSTLELPCSRRAGHADSHVCSITWDSLIRASAGSVKR